MACLRQKCRFSQVVDLHWSHLPSLLSYIGIYATQNRIDFDDPTPYNGFEKEADWEGNSMTKIVVIGAGRAGISARRY